MFGETTIFCVMIWNHPIETTIKNWLSGVPGMGVSLTGATINILGSLNSYHGLETYTTTVGYYGYAEKPKFPSSRNLTP